MQMRLTGKNEDTNAWDCLLALNTELNKHRISYTVNFACGIFTAVLSCKDQIPIQNWIELFMNESNANANDIDTLNELLQALLGVYNKIAMQLYDDEFEPVLLESQKIIDWSKSSAESIMDWCFGYCRGMDFSPSLWLKEQYEYSMPIAILGGITDVDDEDQDQPTNEELRELAMMIPSLAQSVYNIGFDAREDELQSKKNHKLGRNDLCFCGSSKKFKKCCLGGSEVKTIH